MVPVQPLARCTHRQPARHVQPRLGIRTAPPTPTHMQCARYTQCQSRLQSQTSPSSGDPHCTAHTKYIYICYYTHTQMQCAFHCTHVQCAQCVSSASTREPHCTAHTGYTCSVHSAVYSLVLRSTLHCPTHTTYY